MKVIASYILLCLVMSSCVQKTYNKTVVYLLEKDSTENVKKAGIRGSDKPLNWNNDSAMVLQQDSSYKVTITYKTGYKFTEAKFVVDDEIELDGKGNRRIVFDAADTTFYRAKFNVTN